MSTSLFHLVLGDSAGGVVRAACDEHGLPGSVHVIPDDLSHGPLHDGKARLSYMRASFVGFDRWETQLSDAFACWDALDARLAAAPSGIAELAVWAGDNNSEAVLLAMACHRLEGAEQAAIFRRLRAASRAETGQLRLWQRGNLVAVPADRLDALLLRACSSDWRPAAGVVGGVMAGCDPHNLASDLFLTARLQRLIDRGRVEAMGPRDRLRDYWVRLAVD